MKKLIKAMIISLCVLLIFSIPVMAKSKDEKAIEKQIKVLDNGLKKHDYSIIKKVVKKKYSWYDFKKYDKIIGKKFLKQFSNDTNVKLLWTEVHGKTADAKIRIEYFDFSTYYYYAHRYLWLEGKHSKENYSKKVKEFRAYLVERDARIAPYIYGEYNVTMNKVNGKWVLKEDPNGEVFNAYTLGYKSLYDVCGNLLYTSDF